MEPRKRLPGLGGAEDPLEDSVYVAQVRMHVEQRLKFGRRKCRAYLGVRLQKLQERTLAAEGAHGTLLHEAIGVLAGEAFLRERQQHLLGVNQAAAAFQILQHSLRVHHEPIDHPGQPR